MENTKTNISHENTFGRVKTNLSIYDDMEINLEPTCSNNFKCFQTSISNVLETISQEALTLQAVDRNTAKTRRKTKTQIKANKSFIPLAEFQDFARSVPTNSEPQIGVSDTQLLAYVEGAEAVMHMVANQEMTQLFDSSFEKKSSEHDINATENSYTLQKQQENEERLQVNQISIDKDINLHATENYNQNICKDFNQDEKMFYDMYQNMVEDCNTMCNNSNDNGITSSPILKQKNMPSIIVNEDNYQVNKTKNNMSIDSLDSNTIDDNFNDNITSSPILNKRSPYNKIYSISNNDLDNKSENYLYDSNIPSSINVKSEITSSLIIHNRSADYPISVGNKKYQNDKTDNNQDDSNTMLNNNITNPIIMKKNDDEIIICDKDCNRNDKNKTKRNRNNQDDSKSNIRSHSKLKRKSDYNLLSYKCDNNQNDKSSTNYLNSTKRLASKDDCLINPVRSHKKSASQKIIYKSKLLSQKKTCHEAVNKTKDNGHQMVLELRSFSLHDFESFEAACREDLESSIKLISGDKGTFDSHSINNEIRFSQITDEEYEYEPNLDVKKRKINISCLEFEKENISCKSDRNLEEFTTCNNEKITSSKKTIVERNKSDDTCVNIDLLKTRSAISLNNFGGFKTADNKKNVISEEAIAKSKMLLNDACVAENRHIPNVSTFNSNTNIQPFSASKTANNKRISISADESYTESNIFLDEEACLLEAIFKKEVSCGISTLKSATTTNKYACFSTSNNKDLILTDSITKNKMLLDEACLEENMSKIKYSPRLSTLKSNTITNNFESFFTATNSKVLLSEDAIAKSKKLLNEACSEQDIFEIEKTSCVSTLKPDTTKKCQGFITANNNKISISEDAIAKSRKLLDEACLESDIFEIKESYDNSTIKTNTNKNKFEGFSTASNKRVSISEDAIAKSRKLLDEACLESDIFEIKESYDNSTIKTNTNKNKFEGFSTASNKRVSISEDAIAKSRKLLDEACLESDIFEIKESYDNSTIKTNTNKNKFEGFSTASNKRVSISEDAIAKSRKLLDEACLESDIFEIKESYDNSTIKTNTNKNKFEGFSTASNKRVSISEDAIAKSRKLLDEACLESDIFEIEESYDNSTIKTNTNKNKFEGFSTARNKKVSISEDAIAKSRKFLDEACLEESIKHTSISKLKSDATLSKFVGFSTASHKNVSISSKAIAESKKIFERLEETNVSTLKSNMDFKDVYQIKIKELIDTQVINNFDHSKFTQENEAVEMRKKAGSPILSCPNAKKYKNFKKTFKVPYSQTKTQKNIKIDDINSQITQNVPQLTIPKMNFTNLNHIKSNRSNKRILLKDLKGYKDNLINKNNTIDNLNINNNLDDLLHHKFNEKHEGLSDLKDVITFKDLKCLFEKSVNKSLIPNGWIENHFKLILWKLISYERLFGNSYDRILSVENILDQLKYRYDRELYLIQRPAIRKVLECDEPANRTMVLCVANIYNMEDSISTGNHYELDLTDSWYIVRSTLDAMLNLAVETGKIKVGTKLLIYGAELQNCDQGKSPLEDTSAVRLKIFGNSTRRVPWDTKLGFFQRPGPFRIKLNTVKPTGRKIAKIRLFVARVYPPIYIEKLEDGSTVSRSERQETIYASKFESEKQNILEKIYAQIEKEFSDYEIDSQDDSPDANTDDENSQKDTKSGSQLFRVMKKCQDPVDFQAHLSSTQTNRLRDFNSKEKDRVMSKIQERVQQKVSESGVDKLKRNVIQLAKVRIVDWSSKPGDISRIESTKKQSSGRSSDIVNGVISIWKPSEGLSEIIKEGIWLDVINSTPTAIRMSEIHISAGRQTIFNKSKYNDVNEIEQRVVLRNVKSIENLVENVRSDMLFNEIDTVGLIVGIEPEKFTSKSDFQNVFLTDRSTSVICLNFWGGIEKFGFTSLLKTGAFISCSNLQKRMGNSNRRIPHFRVTELSCFSLFPRNVIFSDALKKIKNDFVGIEIEQFCRDFQLEKIKKRNVSSNVKCSVEMSKSTMSPFMFQNKTEYDLEKNKEFIETPQIREAKRLQAEQNALDMNLDGIDFESTFSVNSVPTNDKMTPTKMTPVNMTALKMTPVKIDNTSVEVSPRLQEQRKRTKARIQRLNMYGEAPKLSPITILNGAEVTKSYVDPLAVKNDILPATYVASVNNDTVQNYLKCVASESKENSEMLPDSPKTNSNVKRRRINPVKLQFHNENRNECSKIHDGDFADDFEYSPPLSLD